MTSEITFSLSTHWNAWRHSNGRELVEEILQMGFSQVELGYDTRMDLVEGVQQLVQEQAVTVSSVHNFCPVPVGAPRGHPELFTLADKDPRIRNSALHHTQKTIRFAAEIGAPVVVCHAGNVKMKRRSMLLISMIDQKQQFSPAYEKQKMKLITQRDKKISKQFDYLKEGLEKLLPVLEECRVTLALENLPTWEAIPTETEAEELMRQFNHPHLKCWYDIGHGQIREDMGLINQQRWVEKLTPHIAGMHVHDVVPPGVDHVMPPQGHVDFSIFSDLVRRDIPKVIEPHTKTPAEDIIEATKVLQNHWNSGELPTG